jgi:tRNA_anti-like
MPRYDDDDDRPRRRRPRDDDEDDDRPSSRRKIRRRDEDDFEDRPRRKRPKTPELNVAGAVAVGIGALALVLTITPCLSVWFGIVPAIVGLLVGLVGLYTSQQSGGRQKPMLPIAGMSISAVAVLIAVSLLVFFKGLEKAGEKMAAEWQAEAAKAEAEHKAAMAKAATDVKAAGEGQVIRLTAVQFYQAFDNDEDRAERLYRNKVIEVTGTIQEVDFTGATYTVYLKGGPEDFETVDCQFAIDPAVRERLAQLRPGQTVTIRGKCLNGFSDLEACILVQ